MDFDIKIPHCFLFFTRFKTVTSKLEILCIKYLFRTYTYVENFVEVTAVGMERACNENKRRVARKIVEARYDS